MGLVIASFAIDVAFPTLVTTPVKFALVVTLDDKVAVAAFPEMFTPHVPVAPAPEESGELFHVAPPSPVLSKKPVS
jgi:hypothetical protein